MWHHAPEDAGVSGVQLQRFGRSEGDHTGLAEHLKAHLEAEHSLYELSRRFHLNECKLKSGFKQVYNQTVFGYLRECPMQRAEALLRETDGSVLDIACEAGYSNASHFSCSFKERFGMLPKACQCLHSAVRRERKSNKVV